MLNELDFREYIIHNNILVRSSEIRTDKIDKPSIYEVLSIINGKPLFIEDHIDRLMKSAKLKDIQLNIDIGLVKEYIRVLCAKNKLFDGYLRMLYSFDNSRIENILYYFIKQEYPSKEDYIKGVKTSYLSVERDMPNVKLSNLNLSTLASDIKKRESVYEVLLVDKNKFVTEGSRSNLFLIKDNVVITPPSKKVLEGITRKHIIEICNENDIEYVEQSVLVEDIQKMDAIFLTGTSSKVLPVRTIDNYSFDISNALINKLMILYDDRIRQYLHE